MNTAGKYQKSPSKSISIRCYAELNDFLPAEKRQQLFTLTMKEPVTVAETIQKLGIPLSEVDLVIANGQAVGRSYRLVDNDCISIYPTFETFDISSLKTTHHEPLRITRFILDAHLGKLAKYLRMLGFDTLYKNDYGDEEIIAIASEQNRIILTRDKLLLRSPGISHGYYVRNIEKHSQLVEVVEKFDLYLQFKSFSRCMTCNTPLGQRSKDAVSNRIDPDIVKCYNEFFYCPSCDKVFWKGSHFKRMEQMILEIAVGKKD